MPNYFADYDTTVNFVSEKELKENHAAMPHGGFVIRSGKTGINNESNQVSVTAGQNNEFALDVTEKWNEFADTIIRCILYAFVMRYWKFLPENSKDIVRLRVEEEFSTTDILKDFI